MTSSQISIQAPYRFVFPRASVEVHLPDGRVIEGPRGTPVGNFLKLVENQTAPSELDPTAPIVGAVVNGELRELTYPITMDSRIHPVTMAESDGMLIYRRSLTFLLDAAFEDLFPEASLTIDHSVSFGGYYCRVSGMKRLSANKLKRLERHMRKLVTANLPFIKREVSLTEAVAYFQAKGHLDKVRLLAHRTKDYLVLYRLGDHQDYHHGYMVPSTGYLRWFAISPTNGGFTLRFTRLARPTEIQPLPDYPKLLLSFRQYGEWLDRLGIANVGSLNDAIESGHIREIILASEALHEQHVAEIARQIVGRGQVRLVLISGPSSSGKTTFSKRLAIQLIAQGFAPFALEMDNYFLDRDQTPLDENGKPDFESIRALDINLLANNVQRLTSGDRVLLPHFDFKTGKREPGEAIMLQPGQIIIMEGIHGLNPELHLDLTSEQAYRIYVSCLTQLNLDRHNRISTTDTRLLRRIVRDARERGYSAQDTISRWDAVRRGEKLYIFPYQENADVMFNSALAYELSALKPLVEPLLRQVTLGTPEYIEAKRLLALLEWFRPIVPALIPENSILREFLGESILREFTLWLNR
jgi:uridine kinase